MFVTWGQKIDFPMLPQYFARLPALPILDRTISIEFFVLMPCVYQFEMLHLFSLFPWTMHSVRIEMEDTVILMGKVLLVPFMFQASGNELTFHNTVCISERLVISQQWLDPSTRKSGLLAGSLRLGPLIVFVFCQLMFVTINALQIPGEHPWFATYDSFAGNL